MPKVSGVFDIFENLENLQAEDISRWLKGAPDPAALENYLANKVIYPQAVPQTLVEQNIDLAILREALKKNPIFFKSNQKKIYIPDLFLQITTDIKKIITLFIDAYAPSDFVTFVLSTKQNDEVLGSLIKVNGSEGDSLYFNLGGKNFKVKGGNSMILPCPDRVCHVSFKSESSTIFGKKELLFEVPGGRLGLIIDGRKR